MPTRCCMPPDSSDGYLVAKSLNPTKSSRSWARASASTGSRRRMRVGKMTFCSTVSHGSSTGRLEHDAHAALRPLDDFIAVDDLAAARRVEAGNELQQRRFSASGRPDHADELAVAQRQRNVVERPDLVAGAGRIDLGYVADLEQRGLGHRFGGGCRRQRQMRRDRAHPEPHPWFLSAGRSARRSTGGVHHVALDPRRAAGRSALPPPAEGRYHHCASR